MKTMVKDGAHPGETPDHIQDRVVELYRSGMKTAEITAETGITRPMIYVILNRRGITPTRAKRPTGEVNTDQLLQRLDAQAREIGRLEAELAAKQATIDELISQLGRKR